MKRLYFAIGLLVLSIAFCTAEQKLVSKINYTSSEIISQALDAIDENNYGKVKSSCKELDDFWQKHYSFMSAMVDHSCFDDASANIEKIKYMAENKDEELESTLLELKGQIEEIKKDEEISFGNIF
ncbi:MAG: DUF4363 family protein [Eubacterium sp.]|nr:DUF4363 family protein [Eubacterium sp.]